MADRWTIWKRIDIPDFDDPSKTYLTRWKLLKTPWFGIYLHCIRMADNDRHLHSHPWNFGTLILSGGYEEEIPADAADPTGKRIIRTWKPGSFHFMHFPRGASYGEYHRIKKHLKGRTWSFLAVGRWQKDWGFLTEDGFVEHGTYHAYLNKYYIEEALNK